MQWHAQARCKRSHIITGHSRLPGDTSRDDNDLGSLESLSESIVLSTETDCLGRGVDVRKVGSDTGSAADIVARDFRDERVLLGEESASASLSSSYC